MRRVLGVLTRDFRLYHDLVNELKARGLPFETLSFDRRIPNHIGVVITSQEEASRVKYRRKVVAFAGVNEAIVRALNLLEGRDGFEELVVGVDPGPRPGIAVVGDGSVVEEHVADTPEGVGEVVRTILKRNRGARRVTVRVGHGDRTNRNRIINALAGEELRVEIADEEGTSPGFRRDDRRNIEAAREIAFTPGSQAERWYHVEPTEGELKEIQRLSRIDSDGEITISRELALEVARGKLTMVEAIRKQRGSRSPAT